MAIVNPVVPPAVNPWAQAAIVQPQMDPGVGTLWPGAIPAEEHQPGEWMDHNAAPAGVAGGRPSPATPPGPNPLTGDVPGDVYGSGYVPSGVAWLDHDVANPVWDSDAGNIHGPGGVSAIHQMGRGSSPKFFETPADIGHRADLRIPNQSYAPDWEWDAATGQRQSIATQWVAHDQVPDVNGAGIDYAPRFYEYTINPVTPNLAEVAQPYDNPGGPYAVSGATPDYSDNFDQQSVIYAPPADPQVNQAITATAPYGAYANQDEDW